MYFNKKRADKLMDQFDIDLLIASTPENVTYLSDTAAKGLKFILILLICSQLITEILIITQA